MSRLQKNADTAIGRHGRNATQPVGWLDMISRELGIAVVDLPSKHACAAPACGDLMMTWTGQLSPVDRMKSAVTSAHALRGRPEMRCVVIAQLTTEVTAVFPAFRGRRVRSRR